MASHLRLHLAALPPLSLPHRRRLQFRRLPQLPASPLLNTARAPLPAGPHPLLLLLLRSHGRPVRAVGGGAEEGAAEPERSEDGGGLVGEDSAAFRLGDQSLASWAYFGGILAAVLFALNVLWIDPGTGVGTRFLDTVASVSDSHEVRLCSGALCLLHRYGFPFISKVLRIPFISKVLLMDKKMRGVFCLIDIQLFPCSCSVYVLCGLWHSLILTRPARLSIMCMLMYRS